ncbi:hypothetical protein S7W_03197 [Mycobacteroides abscessus M94]|nr:hypothetical protein S7W_03197 [Mycobacteroides abscessus M94]
MPQSGEIVEGSSHNLAGPFENEGTGVAVVGAGHWRGLAGKCATGFRRSLVEHLVVPGHAEGAEITAQLVAAYRDLRRGGTLAGLWVRLIRSSRKADAVELNRLSNAAGHRISIAIERIGRLRLILTRFQAAIGTRCQQGDRVIRACRIAIGQIGARRITGRPDASPAGRIMRK